MWNPKLGIDAGGEVIQEVFMAKKIQRMSISSTTSRSSGEFEYPIIRICPTIDCFINFGDNTTLVTRSGEEILLPSKLVERFRIDETISKIAARSSGEAVGFLNIVELG